jgi:hypothetical protein
VYVARIGEKRNAYRILVENQREGDHYGDLAVGRWIMLGSNLKR